MIVTVQGVDAYCYTGGKAFNPAQPSAVFIHGAQNDHSVWILQTRYFAHHGFNVLALDLPGHGRSKGAALPGVQCDGVSARRMLAGGDVAIAVEVEQTLQRRCWAGQGTCECECEVDRRAASAARSTNASVAGNQEAGPKSYSPTGPSGHQDRASTQLPACANSRGRNGQRRGTNEPWSRLWNC